MLPHHENWREFPMAMMPVRFTSLRALRAPPASPPELLDLDDVACSNLTTATIALPDRSRQ
jgi:hypothetical protein